LSKNNEYYLEKFILVNGINWNDNVFSYENNFIPDNSEKPTLSFMFISVDFWREFIVVVKYSYLFQKYLQIEL
jgi:hypothetical protein